MPEAYQAILRGDRLEWTGTPPGPEMPGQTVEVEIAGDPPSGQDDEPDRRRRAIAALERIAARGTFADIEDSVAWQREIRQDRPLPGREE